MADSRSSLSLACIVEIADDKNVVTIAVRKTVFMVMESLNETNNLKTGVYFRLQ